MTQSLAIREPRDVASLGARTDEEVSRPGLGEGTLACERLIKDLIAVQQPHRLPVHRKTSLHPLFSDHDDALHEKDISTRLSPRHELEKSH